MLLLMGAGLSLISISSINAAKRSHEGTDLLKNADQITHKLVLNEHFGFKAIPSPSGCNGGCHNTGCH